MPDVAYRPAREQSMDALVVAQHVRTTNARTLKEVKSYDHAEGLGVVADMLRHADMDRPIGTLPVWRLLTAIRGVGELRAEEALEAADVFRMRRPLRRLTTRQRHRLAAALDEMAAATRARS